MTKKIRICFIVACLYILISLSGCIGGFKPDKIIVASDAPLLITDANGEYLEVSAHDRLNNKIIVVGWCKASEFISKTIIKFDWNKVLKPKETD